MPTSEVLHSQKWSTVGDDLLVTLANGVGVQGYVHDESEVILKTQYMTDYK